MEKWTEYVVRTIDAHGDAIDCCEFPTLAEASADYNRTVSLYAGVECETKAFSLERVTRYEEIGKHARYVTLRTHGDAFALSAGGWR